MNKTIWAIVIIIIVVIGGWFIYQNMSAPAVPATTTTDTTQTTGTSATATSDNIYLTASDPTKGNYMTDFAGKTLYTYSKDTAGVSNCTGACAAAWPPYTSGATAQGNLPANVTVITRADGSTQFAWMGMPLYYFASDTSSGQITGDGVGNFHIIKM